MRPSAVPGNGTALAMNKRQEYRNAQLPMILTTMHPLQVLLAGFTKSTPDTVVAYTPSPQELQKRKASEAVATSPLDRFTSIDTIHVSHRAIIQISMERVSHQFYGSVQAVYPR